MEDNRVNRMIAERFVRALGFSCKFVDWSWGTASLWGCFWLLFLLMSVYRAALSLRILPYGHIRSAPRSSAVLVEDGQAGLDAVATAQPPFDLVFMDCQMPLMDGVRGFSTPGLVPASAPPSPCVVRSHEGHSQAARSRAIGSPHRRSERVDAAGRSRPLPGCGNEHARA